MGKFKVGDKVRVRRLKDMFCDPDIKVSFYYDKVTEFYDPDDLIFVNEMFPIAGTVVSVTEDVSGRIMERYRCYCKNDTKWYLSPFFIENEVIESD